MTCLNDPKFCYSNLFAVDTTLAFNNTRYKKLTMMCKDELKNFHNWPVLHRFSVNKSRIFYMIFGSEPLQ